MVCLTMSGPNDSKLLSALRHCRNVVSAKTVESEVLSKELEVLVQLIQTDTVPTKTKQNLESFLKYLILNVQLDWISWNLEDFENNGTTFLFEFYMKCPPDLVLLSLLSAFTELSTGARQELCLRLLEIYFKRQRFVALLLQESSSTVDKELFKETIRQNLLTTLNSLPNKVANNTMGKFSDIFHHEQFFQLLAIQTDDVIENLVENVRNGKDVSTSFISQMIGVFCFCGKADAFLGPILPLLTAKCSSDFVWRKIVQKIVSGLPERNLEAAVTYIARKLPWCGCMKWLFEDSILQNSKLKFILLHKLILVKYYPEPIVLRNIIGYISEDSNTQNLLIETLKKLLSIWADSSAIRHVSYEQHKYVTQAILICIGQLTEEQRNRYKHDLAAWLAPGMSSHLDSTDSKVRRLGMIVGEAIAERTDFKGENKLEFGFEKDEETECMVKLLTPEPAPPREYYQDLLQRYQATKQEILSQVTKKQRQCVGCVTTFSTVGSVTTFSTSKATLLKVISCQKIGAVGVKNPSEAVEKEELDSDDDEEEDDDLQPYDMSNDTVYRKVKPPTYIRDCMVGLTEREDREKFEVSFGAVKDLIEKNPLAAKEVSIELCRILLDLDDAYALNDFTTIRMSAMTSLTVIDPEKVATYLTHEFYVEQYCLQHRLDILDVLTAAAKNLSSVEREGGVGKVKELQKEAEQSHSAESWRDIVDKRIEAKTRRFGKARKKTLPPKENRFGPIAGCFFYPLLAEYDKRIRTLDLMGNDAIVLGRLLYSVGMIVYSAINTTAGNMMAKSLLEFVLEMRFHSEAYVRQAALFSISMSTITAGKNLLGLDVLDEITEWVHDILSNDTNTRTKQLAVQTAMLMSTHLSKNIQTGSLESSQYAVV